MGQDWELYVTRAGVEKEALIATYESHERTVVSSRDDDISKLRDDLDNMAQSHEQELAEVRVGYEKILKERSEAKRLSY